MEVKHARPSAFSPARAQRWVCVLACGHEVWVTSDEEPETANCRWGCPEASTQGLPPASTAPPPPKGGSGETPETAAFKERWGVELHCRHCGAVFEVERSGLHVSLQPTQPFTRLVLFAAPEVCPSCKSLHSVPPVEPEPEPEPERPSDG